MVYVTGTALGQALFTSARARCSVTVAVDMVRQGAHRKAQADVVVLAVAVVDEQGCRLEQYHQQPPLLFLQGFLASKHPQTQQDCWEEHCIGTVSGVCAMCWASWPLSLVCQAGKPTYNVRSDDCQPHQKLAVRSFISMRSVQGYCIWLKQVYGLPKDPTLHARNQSLFAGQTGSSSMTAYLVSTERRVI